MNDELYCTYEQAVELRDLGFNEPCFKFQYVSDTPKAESSLKDLEDKDWVGIPLKMQALAFLRIMFNLEYPNNTEDIDEIIYIFIELAKKQQK